MIIQTGFHAFSRRSLTPTCLTFDLLQVTFVVRAGDGLESVLPSMSGSQSSAADLQRLQQEVKLKVSWSLSASGASSAVPALQLILPPILVELLGKSSNNSSTLAPLVKVADEQLASL
jgi:hypothetical protein